jgi:hypothetical protein
MPPFTKTLKTFSLGWMGSFYIAVSPSCQCVRRGEVSKIDGNLVSMQASEMAIIVHFSLKVLLLLCRCSLDNHGVSVT